MYIYIYIYIYILHIMMKNSYVDDENILQHILTHQLLYHLILDGGDSIKKLRKVLFPLESPLEV